MIFPRSVGFRITHHPFRFAGVTIASLILLTFFSTGRAAFVTYVATDVADTSPGQDLWEYAYTVGLADFSTGEGFTVSFDRHLYTLLQNPPPFVNADWDPLTVQPDLALNSDGFYDALALRDNPSLADPFKVRFVWLGSGTPGPQPFAVYDPQFQVISQGNTVPIPEPSTLLIGFCIPAAVFFSGRQSHSRRTRASRQGSLGTQVAPSAS